MAKKERKLGMWGKYLTIWVALCMVIGTLLGRYVSGLSGGLEDFSVADISIPIAICLFLMIYPIMVQISWEEIKGALKSPKPLGLTLFFQLGHKTVYHGSFRLAGSECTLCRTS